MRVLLVVGHATGGIGAHVDSLARDLPGLGHDVEVFTTPLTASRFALGGTVLTAWPDVRALRRLIRRADLVHAHGHQAGLLAALASVGTGTPLVISWHNAVLGSGPRRRLLEVAERIQARRATLLTGASQDLADRARSLGAKSAVVADVAAPTPAPTPAPAPAPASDPAGPAPSWPDQTRPEPEGEGDAPGGGATSTTKDRRRVLTVSRIAPQKRLDVLVSAAALVKERIGAVEWLVAGDGDPDLLARLEAERDRLKAPVTFLGARDDVPALMRACDVFALTSAWEARALVVQEAMAAGLPVVATRVGGVPDLLAGTGVLVEPGDVTGLADAVVGLLTSPERAQALAIAARARFEDLPTEAEVVAAWSQRYQAITRPAQSAKP